MSDDDEDNVHGYGSLGGVGAEEHHKIKSSVYKDGDGILFQVPCGGCPREIHLVALWPELIFMRSGRLPTNNSWVHNPRSGVFMPNLSCRCSQMCRLGITPDECTRHLKAGIAAGKINEAAIAQFARQNGLGQ